MIVGIIEIPKRGLNFEDDVRDFFLKCGYKVVRGNKWSRKNGEPRTGVPDFYVTSPDDCFFVEVKSELDGLKPSQIRWMMRHPNKKILLVIPSDASNRHVKEEIKLIFREADLRSVFDLYKKKKELIEEIENLKSEIAFLKRKNEELHNLVEQKIRRIAKNMDEYISLWRDNRLL